MVDGSLEHRESSHRQPEARGPVPLQQHQQVQLCLGAPQIYSLALDAKGRERISVGSALGPVVAPSDPWCYSHIKDGCRHTDGEQAHGNTHVCTHISLHIAYTLVHTLSPAVYQSQCGAVFLFEQ